ncbi:hypothetical protein GH714_031686 [Hevea brasiliensis]|uniref:Protein Lines N-terminal domain-containing protein n=1 Tax=Hevea brasiliensis TaxID=3981 RepID=A0A6A6L4Y2_HEVBR|nr:hypothetical protein GH714_031686 [Hevea brasiliensis]
MKLGLYRLDQNIVHKKQILEYRDESQRLDQCSRLYDSSVSNEGFELDTGHIVLELGGISTAMERQKALLQELMINVKDMLRNTEMAVRSFMMLRPRFLHPNPGSASNATAPSQSSGTTVTPVSTGQPTSTFIVPVFDFYSGLPKKPSPFLQQTVVRFEKYLCECRQWIEELEQLLLLDSDRNSSHPGSLLLQSLPKVMSNVHDFFVHVASKVESIHQYIASMKTAYLADQRRRGDVNDPFLEADRRETAKQEAAAKRVHPTLNLPANSQPSTQVAGLFATSAAPGASIVPQTSAATASASSGSGFSLFSTPSTAASSSLSSSSLFATPTAAAPVSSLFGSSGAVTGSGASFGTTSESEVISLTRDKEKDLLIALSRVLREIQLMKLALDCDSDKEVAPDLVCDKDFGGSGMHREDHNCLIKILADLIILLTVESRFVQHLVGNILVVISEFVAASQEDDDHLCEMYLDSASSFLSDVPSDFMDEIQIGQSSDAKENDSQNSHFIDALFVRKSGEKEARVVFLGNFIQFLCSLVEQSCAVEPKIDSYDHHPVLCIIISFVPKLLSWCLGEHENFLKMSVSQYFRHKLLMLMLRLSYQTCLSCSTLISWLQLLHVYFEELLWKPIIKLDFGQEECLEGSPFLLSLSDRVHGINSHHLQRWAVLLFVKCCFSLISSTRETSKQCGCATLNSSLTFDSISDLDSYGRRQGFLELYKWLRGHLPTDTFLDHEMYLEKCRGFALSFLQLYMHEDDILFKVLLELLSIQPFLEQQSNKEKWTNGDVKQDTLFYVASIFNPVNLFHLFLAELHYDHQVLLDYLISKDTGITCAEYLLRTEESGLLLIYFLSTFLQVFAYSMQFMELIHNIFCA